METRGLRQRTTRRPLAQGRSSEREDPPGRPAAGQERLRPDRQLAGGAPRASSQGAQSRTRRLLPLRRRLGPRAGRPRGSPPPLDPPRARRGRRPSAWPLGLRGPAFLEGRREGTVARATVTSLARRPGSPTRRVASERPTSPASREAPRPSSASANVLSLSAKATGSFPSSPGPGSSHIGAWTSARASSWPTWISAGRGE